MTTTQPPPASPQELIDDRESYGLQVAGATHHLNNIFAQVLLNAELMDRSRLDPAGQGMLDSIVSGVHAAIRVVQALASQSTVALGEPVALNLKYLLKGFQKRRETLFGEGVVINAQYPPDLRLAWARPAPLLRGVLTLARLTISAASERQTLFLQVLDADGPGGERGVAIDVAAPLPLVERGLRPGTEPNQPELCEFVAAIRDSGGRVEVVSSTTGGTLLRSWYPPPPPGQ